MSVNAVFRWIPRILGAAILVLFLPFYFGYGNPLPFRSEEYTAHDNAWLCAFPLIFAGMVVGWFSGRWGGAIIVIPILIAQAVTMATQHDFVPHMLVPLAVGILYWVSGASGARKAPKSTNA